MISDRSKLSIGDPDTLPNARLISSRRVNDDQGNVIHETTRYGSTTSDTNDGFEGSEESLLLQGSAYVSESSDRSNRESLVGYYPGNAPLRFTDILPYYLPIFSWIREYCLQYFIGDLVGGVSLATFQIPLAISYANSLAKVPITCGLYSLGIAPLIYMILGSVPQMITGPEAPMSLIVGQAVEPLLHHAKKQEYSATEYVVIITFVSGTTLLGFGIGRLGFLDNILCDSLLKGFISGVGCVMLINSLIPSFGLEKVLKHVLETEKDIHSPFDKFLFVVNNFHKAHSISTRVSIFSFLSVMIIRALKKQGTRSRHVWFQNAVYVPEILILVFSTTFLCRRLNWSERGLEIVGDISEITEGIHIYNPLSSHRLKLIKMLSSSGLVCALLGFFESTTASKSLGSRYDLPISSNRELVALGAINLACSLFGGLPSFGGYGRSKINAISAKTPVSGAIMGILSLTTISFISHLLRFIPKCVLSVITAVIGISLVNEGPREVAFHWRSRGYNELFTFAITVLTIIFYSIETGIVVGLVYSLIRVIKNSAESNIQILGRVPGTNNFLNADLAKPAGSNQKNESIFVRGRNEKRPSQLNLFTDSFRPLNVQALEEIEGCLIIRIPEPLTFTNASDLRSRLKRIEMYGSAKAHPALKRSRDVSMTKYIIFDLEGMSYIDSSAAHLLFQSLELYNKRNIILLFVRVSKSRVLREKLERTGIARILTKSLSMIKTNESYEASPLNSRPFEIQETGINERINTSSSNMWNVDAAENPYFDHIRSALLVIDNYEHYLRTHGTGGV